MGHDSRLGQAFTKHPDTAAINTVLRQLRAQQKGLVNMEDTQVTTAQTVQLTIPVPDDPNISGYTIYMGTGPWIEKKPVKRHWWQYLWRGYKKSYEMVRHPFVLHEIQRVVLDRVTQEDDNT